MEDKSKFYTLKGYLMADGNSVTSAMEDYLEMIVRLSLEGDVVRINKLADKLNVKPSSASKMVINLKAQNFVNFEKYGFVTLTSKGLEFGKYLILRHDVLNKLLCFINKSDDELEQVEKIEHFINPLTVDNIKKFVESI